MQIQLRRATDADGPAAAEVWLRSYDAALPTVRRAHTDDQMRHFLCEGVIPCGNTWVAVDESAGESTVVGLMVLDDPEISQLFLDPPYQGRRLGDRFIELAKQRCPEYLELHAFQINTRARRFYERHGFVADRWSDGSDNEENEPDMRYVWRAPGMSTFLSDIVKYRFLYD